jgi:hypothetical protein
MHHAIRTAARFPTEREALEAVEDLDSLPGHDHVRVEVHRGADSELEGAENDLLAGVVIGMAIGAPLGVIAGLITMVPVSRWVTGLGTGMVLGVGIGAGLMFGLLAGGIFGLVVRSSGLDHARDLDHLHLAADEDVVVAIADSPGVADDVRRVLLNHHGSMVRV